jgi:YesN/AraC family two-component response regulator
MDELEEALDAMTQKLNKLPQAAEPAASEATSFVVRRAVAYIEERHAEKISLADVAAACYVSQWHLSKLLSRYKGENFYDILNRARIAEAKRLMLDPSLKIGDISDMVGYSDTPHFSRMFKKLEGVSANEYRNANL